MADTRLLPIQDTGHINNTHEYGKDGLNPAIDDPICQSYVRIINQINTTSSGFREGRKWKCTKHLASCRHLLKRIPYDEEDCIFQEANYRNEQETKIDVHRETAYLLKPLHMAMLPQLGENRVNDIQVKITPDPPRKLNWHRSGPGLIGSRKVESTPSNLSSFLHPYHSHALSSLDNPHMAGTVHSVQDQRTSQTHQRPCATCSQ